VAARHTACSNARHAPLDLRCVHCDLAYDHVDQRVPIARDGDDGADVALVGAKPLLAGADGAKALLPVFLVHHGAVRVDAGSHLAADEVEAH